ncbi:MAG: UDP-N-acetylglucosamine--N-acetylmuramyl-(pentapeptide) pyrophosphoryl-undecaprenol N-acetylglucosamine transferase [Chloroflexi bacterium]|nr:UDP-N-acetylglucosamine--N-acetylmuramyl-(pentapeptide) pyrophosphoryl-undecaprenol N-acetylglucosamine transferase [Chloroflexota bacterium]
MRVLLAGGGSGGSATPILAVASELRARAPEIELLYIATQDGPEAALVVEEGIPYVGIATGKLRRYWDTQNVTDLGRIAWGVGQSLGHVRRFKPDVACGAGGFASVPPLAAAGLLRVPVLIHQQDAIPGLANKLLVPFARKITVALPATVGAFPSNRTTLRGNPVRPRILSGDASEGLRLFGFEAGVPLLLVTGGGTGALGLNRIVAEAAARLVEFCQVLHLTGRGRGVPTADLGRRYQQHELIVSEMPHALAAASVVLSRAGMGTLAELSALGKPTIIVPMPGTHQEANAEIFGLAGAALAFEQSDLTPEVLVETVRAMTADETRRAALGSAMRALMPADAAARIAEDVLALVRPGR